jgi:hypothetical protein
LKVTVKAPNETATGEIDLPSPLSEIMEIGYPYRWSQASSVRAVQEGVLALGKQPQSDDMFFEWLISIQVGLTLVSVLKGQMRPHPTGTKVTGLDVIKDMGDLTDIAFSDGSSGYLAVWDSFLLPGEVERAAAKMGLVEICAPLMRLKTLGGVSLLIPEGSYSESAALAVRDPALFSAPLLSGRVGSRTWDPRPMSLKPPIPPLTREAASFLKLTWSGRGRPPKGFVVPKKIQAPKHVVKAVHPETKWADPFLSIFLCGVPVAPPVAALDAIAIGVCERLMVRKERSKTSSKIAHALSTAYRIGQDPERINVAKASTIHPNISGFIKDRSHAITSLFPAEGPAEDLRRIIRISALEAWWYGALPIRWSQTPTPDRRFREELPLLLRGLSPERLTFLQELISKQGKVDPAEIKGLVPDRAILKGTGLKDHWREAVMETLSAPRYDLPSLLDLLEPTPEALAALEPSWVGIDRQDQRFLFATNQKITRLDPLLEKVAADLKATRSGNITGILMSAVSRAWQLGLSPTGPLRSGNANEMTEEARLYLEEAVRLINTALHSASISPDSLKGAALGKDLVYQAWRSAFLLGAGVNPPARFREGAPARLRHLSLDERYLLLSLLEKENLDDTGLLNGLIRLDLVSPTNPPELTPEGVMAAEAERRHRTKDLPFLADFIRADPLGKRITMNVGSEQRYRIHLDRIARSLARNAGSRRLTDPERFESRLRIALITSYRVGREVHIHALSISIREVINAAAEKTLEDIRAMPVANDSAELERIIRAGCYRVSATGFEPE